MVQLGLTGKCHPHTSRGVDGSKARAVQSAGPWAGPALHRDGMRCDVVHTTDNGEFGDGCADGPGAAAFGKWIVHDPCEGVVAAGGCVGVQRCSGIDGAETYSATVSGHERRGLHSDEIMLGALLRRLARTHPGETNAGVMTAHPAGQQAEASSTSTYGAPGVVAKATTLLAGQRR